MTYAARFMSAAAPLESGGLLETVHKMFLYDDGSAFWELRRPIMSKSSEEASVAISRLIRKSLGLWQVEFRAWGLGDDATVKQSEKAARSSNDLTALDDLKIRQEWSISTAGLLCLLLFWSRHSRIHKHQAWVGQTFGC
jgi:hypothetical protein